MIKTCSNGCGHYSDHLDVCPCCEGVRANTDSTRQNAPLGTITGNVGMFTPDNPVITFIIEGQPIGKQRPRGGKRRYTPKKTKNYEALVGQETAHAMQSQNVPMFAKDIELSVSMIIFREYKYQVDIDNIIKAVLDGMQGVLYPNDSKVHKVLARLYRGCENGRVIVSISELQGE